MVGWKERATRAGQGSIVRNLWHTGIRVVALMAIAVATAWSATAAAGTTIYFDTGETVAQLWRAQPDGTGLAPVTLDTGGLVGDIQIDPQYGWIYLADPGPGEIKRLRLDGRRPSKAQSRAWSPISCCRKRHPSRSRSRSSGWG